MLQAKTTVRKIRFIWNCAPDKTARWLENLEQKGYNLDRIGWWGSFFYFKKGQPRTMRYVATYQQYRRLEDYERNTAQGWQLIFNGTANSKGQFLTLWAHPCTDEEPVPCFIGGETLTLRVAKRNAVMYSICFGVLLPLYLGLLLLKIFDSVGWDSSSFIFFGLQTLLVAEYTFFTTQSVGFYRRLKKNEPSS